MGLSSGSRSKRSRRVVREESVSPYVRRTGGFRRKRIEVIGVERRIPAVDASITTKNNDSTKNNDEASLLESLPHEILVKLVSCVDHDDLRQLFRVSRTIREAALMAKRTHFAYSTPTKIRAFRTSLDWNEEEAVGEEIEAPGAPLQGRRYKSRMSGKKLVGISISLFDS